MKKYLLFLTLMATMAMTAQANLVSVRLAANHSFYGGEFILTPDNGAAFNTFSAERFTDSQNVGKVYSYQISNESNIGRYGPHYVSLGTAWLYSNFRNGTLSGFTGTHSQQTSLQSAIWYLEGELKVLNNGDQWIMMAQQALGPNVDLFNNSEGKYGVDIWNLTDGNRYQCQAVLGMTNPPSRNVPEVGTWWLALAMFLPFTLRRFVC